MTECLPTVMHAIEFPDHREADPRPGRERYFARGGPQGWIRVVTAFDRDADRVITAFPQANDPRRGRIR
ncbi:MAG: hypothetical protein QOJ38_168 [Solirubrobacterales bacterium]|nr:hypothetical protein [Solirubrobacterales bacterium]